MSLLSLFRREPPRRPRLATVDSFRLSFHKSLCDSISRNLVLHGNGVATIGSKRSAMLVKWIIDNDFVPMEDIKQAVHRGIRRHGREMYEWCRDRRAGQRYPDDSLAPEALGYAMKHGELTKREIAKLRFNHFETAEEYMAKAEGLLEKVMRQLRSGTAYFALNVLYQDECGSVGNMG